MAAASSSSSASTLKKRKEEKAEDPVLISVVNQLYALLERLLQLGHISKQDIVKPPTWLKAGILAFSLVEALQRSLHEPNAILLASHEKMTIQNCPPHHLPMFQALCVAKQHFADANLNSDKYDELCKHVLYQGTRSSSSSSSSSFNPMVGSKKSKVETIVSILSLVATNITNAADWTPRWNSILSLFHQSLFHSSSSSSAATSSSSSSSGKGASTDKTAKDTTEIWTSVVNRAYMVGEEAIQQKWISVQDIMDQESYLYFGLIGATVLDAVKRSMSLPPGTIALATQKTVTLQSCPADLRPLMTALVGVRQSIVEAKMTNDEKNEQEWILLRTIVLWASADNKPDLVFSSVERKAILNKIASQLQTIATQVSQTDFFKQQFNNVLLLLADAHRPSPALSSVSSSSSATSSSTSASTAAAVSSFPK